MDGIAELREYIVRQAGARLRNDHKGAAASYVSWGFKAPVSMTLVPFFEQAWGQAKFLHVVRDGRDIAFSGNQTPIEKFYKHTFAPGTREGDLKEPELKAIKMWNVWNAGLYQWAAKRNTAGHVKVDYLLLHVEDLIDPAAKVGASPSRRAFNCPIGVCH